MKSEEELKLTPQEWEAVKDEAEFISATKGHDYNTAFKIAEERVRKAVGKENK
jgi:hypothetical protein